MKELTFNGTANEVLEQIADWRNHGLRYVLLINGSVLNRRLRKSLATNLPYVKVLRGLKKL
jgi:phthiodiolone/phenolphthiodiolone dimycocerosates ketoreductase